MLARIRAEERLVAAPELVIEILSPGAENSQRGRVMKRHLYAKYGVEEYWIVDPLVRAIEIYRLREGVVEPAATLQGADELTSPHLPEFSERVKTLFV
jgi:Uma2 family endonuclease